MSPRKFTRRTTMTAATAVAAVIVLAPAPARAEPTKAECAADLFGRS